MYFTRISRISLLFLVLVTTQLINAQSKLDSLQYLNEVVITAKTYKEVIPAQKLTGDDLKALNSFSVADAIRYFSGIQVKDYGGIGGLKTVNIRSMGTHHVGVFYDGIQLGNAQNGIVDLGKFSLDNMDEISLYNGQKSEIFQPAKDFGSSGSIYLRSRSPHFTKGKKQNIRATVKSGSFDLINPSILYEHKINSKVSTSFSGELINSSGKYRFRQKRVYPGTHEVAHDTTGVRNNGDIFSYRLEAGAYGVIPEGSWKVKSYYYNSNRGLPSAIISTATGQEWTNNQRQWDRNFFTQASFQKQITAKYELLANAKFAYDYMRFLTPEGERMYVNNRFHQREFYASLANRYAITSKWDASLATDVQYNTLSSNMKGFTPPRRITTLIAAASAIEIGRVKMQGSVLATLVDEKIKLKNVTPTEGPVQIDTTVVAPNKYEVTPAFFISYKPFRNQDFNLRAFYKNIFRMPTFNDLYYTNLGNSALKPEYTHQFNLGFQYDREFKNGLIKSWQLQSDAYYSEVTDKIVAVPSKSSLNRWTMINYGFVEIRGLNISTSSTLTLPLDVLLNLKLAYTFEKAQDFTHSDNPDLEKEYWGGQIAYAPKHSGSIIGSFLYKSWQLNYSFIYVGERYHSSENTRDFYEQPWYTHDVSVVKQFRIKKINLKVSGEVNNLFSQDYEVVLNYPMPKRNYKISLTVEI